MVEPIAHHVSVTTLYVRFAVQRVLEYPFSLLGISVSLGFSYIWIGVSLKLLVDNFQPLCIVLVFSNLT